MSAEVCMMSAGLIWARLESGQATFKLALVYTPSRPQVEGGAI